MKRQYSPIIRSGALKWKSQIQIFGFRSRRLVLFCEGTLWFETQLHRQHASFQSNKTFPVFTGKVFIHLVRIQMNTDLALFLVGIFQYLYGAKFIVIALDRKEQLASQFNFTHWSMTYSPLIIRLWELSRSDASPWAWDLRHEWELH